MSAQPTGNQDPSGLDIYSGTINAEQGRMPDGMNGLSTDDGPFGAPGVSSRLYDSLNE